MFYKAVPLCFNNKELFSGHTSIDDRGAEVVMICKHCSQEIPDDAVHCEKCNKPVDRPWSWTEMALLIVATIFIPLTGFIVGAYGSIREKKKKQGIFLIIFSIINLLIINYIVK